MSLDRDSGGRGRSDEPDRLAPVQRLHVDDGRGSNATAPWYETERFTGQITGRGLSVPTDQPVPAQTEAPVVLDWRHAAPEPPSPVLERLGRALAARRRHRPGTQDEDASPPRRERRELPRAVLATSSQVQPSPAAQQDKPEADEIGGLAPSGPRLGLRGDAEPAAQRGKRRAALSASARGRSHHFRLARAMIVSAVVLSLAAVSVIEIASQTSSTPVKARRASLTAAASSPVAGVGTAAKRAIGALGALEHQLRTSRARHRAAQAHRRPREKPRARGRHVSKQRSVSRHESSPPVTAPSTSSYTNSSSAPSYNPQPTSPPVTSQPAPTITQSAPQTAPTVTQSAPQPAGPSGPGGTVGSNCNPKCS